MEERGFAPGTATRAAYSTGLHGEISPTQRVLWAQILEAADWPAAIATESHALAQDRLVQYCVVVGGSCQYASDAVTLLPGAPLPDPAAVGGV